MAETRNNTASCSPGVEITEDGDSKPQLTLDGPIMPNENSDALFPHEILHHDHYNGVTIHLERCTEEHEFLSEPTVFESKLKAALEEWKKEGKKGIWMYCPVQNSDLVPVATSLGFDFHMVHEKNILILSQWLPENTANRLPMGPTHQVGVGCLVLCPWDRSQMLVVKEKTGPAAAYGLWKMPTGLSDPGEDVHLAAARELLEETGLVANFEGIAILRQAHSSRSGTRASSDLFFVCQMELKLPEGFDQSSSTSTENLFKACPDEIAAIQWMPVEEYCSQDRWQTTPVYLEMNRAILKASQMQQKDSSTFLFDHQTLPLGFGMDSAATNTLYYKKSNL
eukprot:CAMPEP_0198137522 /NCGR_PEP_ID=MMETSP1443-20131203/993_1 /TAXON_ID=186043 /ORGANISM="Entomoneis sp., Strain CCMP2396" /LENGTH=337 /DNA_ID=CAMNT_0043798975 /DNA_START=469 /DNA_END=1482 /DNA_ORIENTATION=+